MKVRFIRYSLYLSILLTALLFALLATEQGLKVSLQLANRYLPVQIQAGQIRGAWWSGFDLELVQIAWDNYSVEMEKLHAVPRLRHLLSGEINISRLDIRGMEIRDDAMTAISFNTDDIVPFPLRLAVDKLVINGFRYHEKLDNLTVATPRIESGFRLSDSIRIQQFILSGDDYRIGASGDIDLVPPYRVDMKSDWVIARENGTGIHGTTRIAGTIINLETDTILARPQSGHLYVRIDNILTNPVYQGTINIPAHKPEYLPSAISLTDISLHSEIAGNLDMLHATGILQTRGLPHGQVNAIFDTELYGPVYGLERIRVNSLQLRPEQGAGVIEAGGQIDITDDKYHASLSGSWKSVDWLASLTDMPVTSADGTFRFAGNHAGYTMEIDTELSVASLISGDWNMSLSGNDTRLDIGHAQGQTDRGELNLAGHLDWSGEEALVSVQGTTDRYLLGAIEHKQITANNGTFNFSGTPSTYTLNAGAGLVIQDYPGAALLLVAHGNYEQFTLERLSLDLEEGHIRLTGRIDHRETMQGELNLAGSGINPGMLWENWPGKLEASGRLLFVAVDNGYALDIPGLEVHGTLRDYPLKLDLAGQYARDDIRIDRLQLLSASSRLDVSGSISRQYNLDWNLDSPDLNQIFPRLQGSLTSAGKLQGRWQTPLITAKAHGKNLQFEEYRLGEIDSVVFVDLLKSDRFEVDISAASMNVRDYDVDSVALTITGTPADHRLKFSAMNPHMKFDLSAGGKLIEAAWTGAINDLAASHVTLGDWHMMQAAAVRYRNEILETDRLCLARQEIPVCGKVRWHINNDWQSDVSTTNLPFAWFNHLYPGNIALSGQVNADVAIKGNTEGITSLNGKAATSQGLLTLTIDEDTVQEIPWEPGTLTVSYAGRNLESNLTINFHDAAVRPLAARIHLDHLDLPAPDISAIVLSGKITTGIRDLAIVEAFIPQATGITGELMVDLDIAGTLAVPRLTGQAALTGGQAYLHDAGIDITDISLAGKVDADGDYTINGSMKSGEGALSIAARLARDDLEAGRIVIRLQGENFEILNLPEVWALASPALELVTDRNSTMIQGELQIPQARIDLDQVRITSPVSDDENITAGAASPKKSSPHILLPDLTVHLGDSIEVSGKGVEGKLKGQLHIFTSKNNDIIADGEISMYAGSYNAYGQSLEIREGRLLYNKMIIDNPELSVRAQKEIGDVTAGIRVSGKASSPVVALFSSPSLSQEQILSYLVFGRPLTGLSSGEGMDLIAAATTLGLQNSRFITDSIANTFGLDDIQVKTGQNSEDTSLVVGKYLTPKLYISYGRGLYQAFNTIRLQYDISRRWALQTESGESTGADLLYKIEK